MRLGLRMGLNSRQGGGGDLPSLDLAFALDKAITARKGPTPDFTRVQATSTGSTYIGADRLIKYAAANEPRFDHDPVTSVCKGLLIEETRTNLVFPSETLTTQTRTVTAVAHTLSFYGTGTVVLSGAHIATVIGTGDFPSRTTLTFTPTAGSLTLTVTGTVQFAQLEAGAFPLSYIPTTSGSAIRGADVCSIIGTDFSSFYNRLACTVDASFIPATIALPTSVCGTNDPRDLEIQMIGGGNIVGLSQTSTGSTAQLLRSGVAVGVRQNFAFASESNNQAVCLNGGTVLASPTWVKNTGTATIFYIGRAGFGGQYSGHIDRIMVFRKRLSNAKLQTLTTL